MIGLDADLVVAAGGDGVAAARFPEAVVRLPSGLDRAVAALEQALRSARP